MRPLILDGPTRARIAEVRQFAELRRYSAVDIFRMLGSGQRLGDDEHYRCEIPMGFMAVFSVEEQPCGWCRHLSMSLIGVPDRLPHPVAVEMILREFGGKALSSAVAVYEEKGNGWRAINVMERAPDLDFAPDTETKAP